MKDEAATKTDVKFANTYYVKLTIRWTISSRLYNFKLEMAVVNPDMAKMNLKKQISNRETGSG